MRANRALIALLAACAAWTPPGARAQSLPSLQVATPPSGDASNRAATTGWVAAKGYLTAAPVTSVAGNTGAVTAAEIATALTGAALANVALTGATIGGLPVAGVSGTWTVGNCVQAAAGNGLAVAAAPCGSGSGAGTITGVTAGTGLTGGGTSGTVTVALAPPSATTLGGVESVAAVAHEWVSAISTAGVPSLSQPAFADLTGTAALATQVSGTLPVANGGTGATTLAGAAIPVQSGTITTGDCVKWASATSITDAGSACGSATGGTITGVTAGTGLTGGGTSGVVTVSLAAPSATTLGGVESVAAVAHEWVSAISTAGVPSLSQPAFADLTGTAALATQVSGTLPVANGGTGATTLAGAAIPVQSGTITTGDCVKWASATSITDAGSACGSATGGTITGVTAGTGLTGGGTSGVVTVSLAAPSATTLGGVESVAAVAHEWVSAISTAGVPSLSQPAFADLTGTAALATQVSGTLPVANGGTGATTLAGAAIPVQSGTITTGDCVKWASATSITDAGSACGSATGGTITGVTAGTGLTGGGTSGVVTVSLAAPSATTLGGVESVAAVAHEWVSAISTAGVPALTQPAFADLTGTAALGSQVSGTLPVANGGTGATTLAAAAIPVQTGAITSGDCVKWATATSITDAGAACGSGGGGGFTPQIVAGRFYMPYGNLDGYTQPGDYVPANFGGGSSSTEMAAIPIYLAGGVTPISVSIDYNQTPTTSLRLGIYGDSAGLPGALVTSADSGTLSPTAAGVVTGTLTGVGSLSAGWYWLTVLWSGAGTEQVFALSQAATSTYGGNRPSPLGFASAFGSPFDTVVSMAPPAFGALPATFPSPKVVHESHGYGAPALQVGF